MSKNPLTIGLISRLFYFTLLGRCIILLQAKEQAVTTKRQYQNNATLYSLHVWPSKSEAESDAPFSSVSLPLPSPSRVAVCALSSCCRLVLFLSSVLLTFFPCTTFCRRMSATSAQCFNRSRYSCSVTDVGTVSGVDVSSVSAAASSPLGTSEHLWTTLTFFLYCTKSLSNVGELNVDLTSDWNLCRLMGS